MLQLFAWYELTYFWENISNDFADIQSTKCKLRPFLFSLSVVLSLQTMVRHGRVKCLSHPLCVAYLNMKWYETENAFIVYNLFNVTGQISQ